MAETKAYVAIGEETTRGTKESTTVGFIPVSSFKMPAPDHMAKKREEFRGEDTALGYTTELRMGQQFKGLTLEMPFFTEAGTVKSSYGTLIKHFFGKATSAQNAATGQYAHMMYPVTLPMATANLGTKAITINMNAVHGATIKNHPYYGGRVSKIGFKQEVGQPLIFTTDSMGQGLATPEAGIASPVFPAENLRCDYNNLVIRQGATVTRTGTAPNYTNITSTGTVVQPDSVSFEPDRGWEDRLILNGTDTPGKSSVKMVTGKLTMVFDFEDPASGFNTKTEFLAWLAGTSSTNFLLTWDTGTQAGTGLNHQLIVDLPICNRIGGMPEIIRDGDPKITLEYDIHLDTATTGYAVGILLMNTATTI